MAIETFYEKYKTIIVIIIIIIIAYIIYRYFWKQDSLKRDVSNLENKLQLNVATDIAYFEDRLRNVESTLGISPSPHPVMHGEILQRTCLNQETQQKIADDINKKLNEINACDCRETCSTMMGLNQKK